MPLPNIQPPISNDIAVTLLGNQLIELRRALTAQTLTDIITNYTGFPSATTVSGTAPIAVSSGVVSLGYQTPLATSGSNLTALAAKPLFVGASALQFATTTPMVVTSGSLSFLAAGALVVGGSALTLAVTAPISQSGSALHLVYADPLYSNSGTLSLGYNQPLYVTGGNLGVNYDSTLQVVAGQLSVTNALSTVADSAEQSMSSGDFTWQGVAPTSFLRGFYRWVQVGKLVTFSYKVEYTTAGVGNGQVQIALPGGAPTPAGWSAGVFVPYMWGTGNISNGTAGDTNGNSETVLYNSSGWKVQTSVNASGSVAAKYAAGTVVYFT